MSSSIEKQQFLSHALDALCFRPKESILLDRGNVHGDMSFRFDFPESFIADRYKGIGPQKPRANARVLSLTDVQDKDALTGFCEALSLGDTFSAYIPKHRRIATNLLNFFHDVRDPRQVIAYFVFLHDRCNPYLFNYVLMIVIMNRWREFRFILPDSLHMFPELFINGGSYNKALTAVAVEPLEVRSIIEIEDRFTDQWGDAELLLNYFREDVSLNVFHATFALLYPTDGPLEYVKKPRRGEIFYYVYQQLVARYNFERLSVGVPRVLRLKNFNEPIPETCFAKLNSKTTASNWPSRMAGLTMRDLDRFQEELLVDLSGLDRWRDRFIDAIDHGFMLLADGSQLPINNEAGIDALGQAMHSTITSPNREFYGKLATMGLVCLGYINDPVGKHAESYGVAGDPMTTLRDPATFRWLALIVDILQNHKAAIPRYTDELLRVPGVNLKEVKVVTKVSKRNDLLNEFVTELGYQDHDLSSGLDYVPRETIRAKFRELQCKPFDYHLMIACDPGEGKRRKTYPVTVRVFLLPTFDERNERFKLEEQRKLAVELDKFEVTCE